jgi:hypothetical protein
MYFFGDWGGKMGEDYCFMGGKGRRRLDFLHGSCNVPHFLFALQSF